MACYDGRIISYGSNSLSSPGSTDKGRSESIDYTGVEQSSAISPEGQSMIESGLLEPLKDATSILRFSRFTIESIEQRD